MTIPVRPVLTLLLILSTATGLAQVAPKYEIDIPRVVLTIDGRELRLGASVGEVTAILGSPRKVEGRRAWVYDDGITVVIHDAVVAEIVLESPFPGKTKPGDLGIGSPLSELGRSGLRILPFTGDRMQTAGIAWEFEDLRKDRRRAIKKIIINGLGIPKPRVERPKPPVPDPKPPVERPRPRDDRFDRSGAPGRNPQVVWDRTWRASPSANWVEIPTTGWPSDRGRVLVRVAAGPGVHTITELYCDRVTRRIQPGDHHYDSDFVSKHARPTRPVTWKIAFLGDGPVRVEVLWFASKNELETYAKTADYATNFAFRETAPPPPRPQQSRYEQLRSQIALVWDYSWRAGRQREWVRGPNKGWPRDRGILLVRAAGGRQVREFLWRSGNDEPQRVGLGDHLVPIDVLQRNRPSNLLEALLGGESGSFNFSFVGRGPVRVQIWWIPEEAIVAAYCAEYPIDALRDWDVGDDRDWIYAGPEAWRRTDDSQVEWSAIRFRPPGGFHNVASSERRARVFESGRDEQLTTGSPFDGGLWYSDAAPGAWIESHFRQPSTIERIDVATAGSDLEEATYVIFELRDEAGRWRRVATLYDENVNWYRSSRGATAISRPSLTLAIGDGAVYTAVRVSFAGVGPFRLGGASVWGRTARDVVLPRDPDLGPLPVGVVLVPAGAGWVDSGCDAISEQALFFDVTGTWTIDSRNDAEWGPCGFEGYAPLQVQRALRRPVRERFQRELPAPDCPAGALIARLGESGTPFLVRPGDPVLAHRGGRVYFACNDPWLDGNDGGLQVTVLGGCFPRARPPVTQFIPARFVGRLVSERTGRPIDGADIIIQMEAWPRTVFGGGRTDQDGAYEFVLEVPSRLSLVIRAPEYRQESLPRGFRPGEPAEFLWNGSIR